MNDFAVDPVAAALGAALRGMGFRPNEEQLLYLTKLARTTPDIVVQTQSIYTAEQESALKQQLVQQMWKTCNNEELSPLRVPTYRIEDSTHTWEWGRVIRLTAPARRLLPALS